MKVDKGTISIWRKATYFPQLTEVRWLQICKALTEMSRRHGRNVEIGLFDLVEFCPHELRDFDVFDYQYASGDARKKSKSSEEEKTSNKSKNTVTA